MFEAGVFASTSPSMLNPPAGTNTGAMPGGGGVADPELQRSIRAKPSRALRRALRQTVIVFIQIVRPIISLCPRYCSTTGAAAKLGRSTAARYRATTVGCVREPPTGGASIGRGRGQGFGGKTLLSRPNGHLRF